MLNIFSSFPWPNHRENSEGWLGTGIQEQRTATPLARELECGLGTLDVWKASQDGRSTLQTLSGFDNLPRYLHLCVPSLSPIQLFVTLWTVACQATLSVGVFRQEYWSRLPFLPPRDLPHLGIKLESPVFFLTQGSDPHLLCLLNGGQSPYLR